ncbi:translation initiation factor IF-2-like [Phyllostomus hastatus]|uniref:translation initiation factor IF-2-like n=1 Tax=Phyllostomus hastatus TaxID=9423 RepID=UPI001E67F0A6|nr:translation initiation factor IF-2-like [Phyllostomus hastatus]
MRGRQPGCGALAHALSRTPAGASRGALRTPGSCPARIPRRPRERHRGPRPASPPRRPQQAPAALLPPAGPGPARLPSPHSPEHSPSRSGRRAAPGAVEASAAHSSFKCSRQGPPPPGKALAPPQPRPRARPLKGQVRAAAGTGRGELRDPPGEGLGPGLGASCPGATAQDPSAPGAGALGLPSPSPAAESRPRRLPAGTPKPSWEGSSPGRAASNWLGIRAPATQAAGRCHGRERSFVPPSLGTAAGGRSLVLEIGFGQRRSLPSPARPAGSQLRAPPSGTLGTELQEQLTPLAGGARPCGQLCDAGARDPGEPGSWCPQSPALPRPGLVWTGISQAGSSASRRAPFPPSCAASTEGERPLASRGHPVLRAGPAPARQVWAKGWSAVPLAGAAHSRRTSPQKPESRPAIWLFHPWVFASNVGGRDVERRSHSHRHEGLAAADQEEDAEEGPTACPCPRSGAAAVGRSSLEVELTSRGGPHLARPRGKPAVLNPTCPSCGCPSRGHSHLLFSPSPLHRLVGAGRARSGCG